MIMEIITITSLLVAILSLCVAILSFNKMSRSQDEAFYFMSGWIADFCEDMNNWDLFNSVLSNVPLPKRIKKSIKEYQACLARKSSGNKECIKIRVELVKQIRQKNSE